MNLPVRIGEFYAQNHREFREMCAHIPYDGKALLEIGSRYGESLKRLAYCLAPGARIVSVDLGADPFSKNPQACPPFLRAAAESLHGYDVHLITGDSHNDVIRREVKALGPFDFCFIDGDHTEAGAMQDWQAYGPLARIVAFHDIGLSGVRAAWDRIRVGKRNVEIICGPRDSMGIGIVWNDHAPANA